MQAAPSTTRRSPHPTPTPGAFAGPHLGREPKLAERFLALDDVVAQESSLALSFHLPGVITVSRGDQSQKMGLFLFNPSLKGVTLIMVK